MILYSAKKEAKIMDAKFKIKIEDFKLAMWQKDSKTWETMMGDLDLYDFKIGIKHISSIFKSFSMF